MIKRNRRCVYAKKVRFRIQVRSGSDGFRAWGYQSRSGKADVQAIFQAARLWAWIMPLKITAAGGSSALQPQDIRAVTLVVDTTPATVAAVGIPATGLQRAVMQAAQKRNQNLKFEEINNNILETHLQLMYSLTIH